MLIFTSTIEKNNTVNNIFHLNNKQSLQVDSFILVKKNSLHMIKFNDQNLLHDQLVALFLITLFKIQFD